MFLTRIALFIALVTPVAGLSQTEQDSAFDRASLSFTPREMLYFDIAGHLEANAPELLPYSEAIGHWSAYYMVSPRLLIALMELSDSGLTM